MDSIKHIDSSELDKTSKIARGERNDCVVRAFTHAFDIPYDDAHSICRRGFGRVNGKGTYFQGYFSSGKSLIEKETGYTLEDVTQELGRTYYPSTRKTRKKTTGSLIKESNPGTYLILVRGHMFTIKDNTIVGNKLDAKRLRARIVKLYKVVEK